MDWYNQPDGEPTIAIGADKVARKQSLMISTSRSTITPIPRDDDLELAPQQENWWYNELLAGHIQPNNLHHSFRLTGPLQPIAVEQIIALLQQRHEALRTAFVPRDRGGARVLITPPEACELPVVHIDLSHLAPREQSDVFRGLSQQERDRPFDLTRGNLCRVILVRLGAEDHVIMFTTHHLIFDEWSLNVLMRDASILYASVVNGTPSQLQPLAFQYVDFARWQRDWLSSPEAAKQFSFWRRQLAPPLTPLFPSTNEALELNAACLVPHGRVPLVINASVAEFARRIARSEKCTLFSILTATVKTLLYALSRQTDLRIGTPIVNRGLPGAEHVVGLFTNVVCLRAKVVPAHTFREFLRVVHESLLDATDNQDLPYEIMVRDLETVHQTSRDSLLHAIVIWMTISSSEPPQFANTTVSSFQASYEWTESVIFVRSNIDLRFELTETPAGIIGHITYNLSRFDVTDIRDLAGAMERCLTLVNMNPKVTMGSLRENLFPSAAASSA